MTLDLAKLRDRAKAAVYGSTHWTGCHEEHWPCAVLRLVEECERLRDAATVGRGPDNPAGCPAGHGDACCGYHDACRAALGDAP